ncbi:LysR family transcriptional regulator [Streptomyces malaysiensis]|uniref:LysR family transcriptional regulator n=1 Tax=Streptomyces malaysiensis subsp. samsunensis TaxID=459658 RepID=A0A9X2M2M8_STRMQ|nr:LysR family transcriptional regulator [Streptomyces samsunensis]MCQ8835295.1 LysR family transcriptional regulator [Streptomyces samsunensis]
MPIPDLTLQQLRAVRTLAASGSFTKAAAAEHISQSVLSRRIKEVERLLRVRLFDRTTRQIDTTAAGQAFLLMTGAVLDDMDLRLSRFMSYVAAQSGTIAVAALPSLAAAVLPEMIRGFMLDHPEVEFEIVDGAADDVVERLAGGTVELGLTAHGDLQDSFCFEPLLQEQFYGVAHRSHPWSTQESISWSDFKGETVLATRPGSSIRAITDAAFSEYSISVSERFNACSAATIRGLLRAGVGVAALPALEVQGFGLDDLVAVPVDSPDATRVIGVAYHCSQDLSPVAARFLDFMHATEIDSPRGVSRVQVDDTSEDTLSSSGCRSKHEVCLEP